MTVLLLAIGSAALLLFHRARWSFWTLWALALAAILAPRVSATPMGQGIFLGVAALLLVLPWIRPLRRRFLVRPLMGAMQHRMPPISPTEREALEAGDTWFEASLFIGRPDWSRLEELPDPALASTEQAFLDGPVERLCRLLDDWRIHERQDLPAPVWRLLRDEGFFGMVIPRAYGGLGFSHRAHSAVVVKLASRSIPAAVTVMVPNSLGPAELLLHYGTEAQRRHYLPRLARGEEIPCFALTGPQAGSDAAALPDTGVVYRRTDGELGIRLDFDKRYITLAPVATLVGLAFRLRDPHRLLGGPEDRGITLALVPADAPGVHIGRRHRPMGVPFQNGPIRGRGVVISLDQVIGGIDGVGRGWSMLMERLATGRAISLPALGVGAGKLAVRAVGAYAAVRRQFGLPIGRFEGVQEALARLGGFTYLMDAGRETTLGALDAGQRPAVITGLIKYQITDHMRRVVNNAMDVLGGAGIMEGPHNLLGRIYQAVPIAITVEGANILTRSLIVFGQGALRAHPFLLELVQALEESGNGYGERRFERALGGWLRHLGRHLMRVPWLTLGAALLPAPLDPVARLRRRIERLSAAFALTADWVLVTQGGGFKRREALSGRLADALAGLYLAAAAVERFRRQGRPVADRPLLEWSTAHALDGVAAALDGVVRNLPGRSGRGLLRLLLFPLGRPVYAPADALGAAVATLLQRPAGTRDRLTAGIFLPQEATEPLAGLETALWLSTRTAELEQRLVRAQRHGRLPPVGAEALPEAALEAGLISTAEAGELRAAQCARAAILPVDSFPAWSPTLHRRSRHEREERAISAREPGLRGGRHTHAVP